MAPWHFTNSSQLPSHCCPRRPTAPPGWCLCCARGTTIGSTTAGPTSQRPSNTKVQHWGEMFAAAGWGCSRARCVACPCTSWLHSRCSGSVSQRLQPRPAHPPPHPTPAHPGARRRRGGGAAASGAGAAAGHARRRHAGCGGPWQHGTLHSAANLIYQKQAWPA